jgi:hypothetical protein
MGRFERAQRNPGQISPIATLEVPTGHTFNGAPGYERDWQSELFLLASQIMVDEKTYYEKDTDRRDRFTQLVWLCAVEHEQWTFEFLQWLRKDANVRSAAIAGACEFVHGRWFVNDELRQRGLPLRSYDASLGRRVCDVVCQRGDEPAELLAYWTSNYGKPIPAAVRRGARDAAERLYTEFTAGKYDGVSRSWRMGDITMLTHPRPANVWQSHLFNHVVGKRLGKDELVFPDLELLAKRANLEAIPVAERRSWLASSPAEVSEAISESGMPWEAFAGWIQGPMDKAAWEACIPSMGLFALLRNLRNFDEAGVSDEVAQGICERLAQPELVRKARLLPMRFLAAYRNTSSLRWTWGLERGLDASLANVPVLAGRSLILIDSSRSMWDNVSEHSEMVYADTAQLFGIALAKRILDSASGSSVEVISFSSPDYYSRGSYTIPFTLKRGESVLFALGRWEREGCNIRQGTETKVAVGRHYASHDRVIVLTDEQADYHDSENVFEDVPDRVPCITYNLAGYKMGHAPSGRKNRHTFGGLSDASFVMLDALASGRQVRWPWELVSA